MQTAVVIPCYNAAEWIGQTLHSVLTQTKPPAEIVVVNDSSTDDSRTVVESFGDRVRLFDQPNQGPSAGRNNGVRLTSSPWVAFLDADDLYEPNFLEEMARLHETFPDAGLLFSDHNDFDQNGVTVPSNFDAYVPDLRDHVEADRGEYLLCGRRFMEVIIRRNGAFSPSCLVMRRDLLEQTGGWLEGLHFGEDLDLYIRALPLTKVGIVKKDRPLVQKRNYTTSLARRADSRQAAHELIIRRGLELYGKHHPELLPLIRQKQLDLLEGWAAHHRREGRYDEAKRCYGQAVRVRPWRLANVMGWLQATVHGRRPSEVSS